MKSLIRLCARKEDGLVELTIGLSKGLIVGIIVGVLGMVSFGYVAAQSKQAAQAMAPRKAINPNQVYSEAVEAGPFVFLSGKIATRQGKVIPGGIKEETKMVMENLKSALAKSGLTMDDVIRTTVYLKTIEDYTGMNEIYQTYWTQDPPARTTVQTGVVLDAAVEIDVIAYRGK